MAWAASLYACRIFLYYETLLSVCNVFPPDWGIGRMTASLVVQRRSEKQRLSVLSMRHNGFTDTTDTLVPQSCQL